MKKLLVVALLALALAVPSSAQTRSVMSLGTVSLEVGMTSGELVSRLPPDVALAWKAKPAQDGVRKADLERKSDGAFLAAIEFTGDRLTRATRLVGPENYKTASADTLTDAIVTTLASWPKGAGVTVSHLHAEGDELREVTFRSGDLELRLVETERLTQLVENLGRGDETQVRVTP
jgi:hypothetical protein